MIKVPVKRNLFYRRIKCPGASVYSGRGVVPNKTAKTRYNNTVMPE
jgi:hypothetical protein